MEKALTKLQADIFDCLSNGMSTKEIVNKLKCSEISVKRVRANKELNAIYKEQKKKENKGSRLDIIDRAIDRLDVELERADIGINDVLTILKQLQELLNIKKDITPPQDIKIEITYRKPEPWQIEAKLEQIKEIEENAGVQSGAI